MSESKIVPNTFQTPNVLVDDLMRLMTGDEVKCYLVVVRKTFGWLKRTDRIAKSQIMELTGLSDGTVDDCMKSLVKYNIVKRLSENDPAKNYGVEWEIQTDDSAIYYGSLQGRANDKAAINATRTAKMRAGGGDVAQPQVVAHTGGGDVAHTPQKPLSTATKEQAHTKIEKAADKMMDGILQNEKAAQASWQGRDKLPPAIRDLADAFVEQTGIKPAKRELAFWLGEISDWLNFGVLRQDVQSGVEYAQQHDFAVMTPASLTKTVRMIAAKRTNAPQTQRIQYIPEPEGQYIPAPRTISLVDA